MDKLIKVLISPSCQGCRKTLKFFIDHEIPIKELNIMTGQLNKAMIRDILSLTENGSEDIISSRSKVIKQKKIDVNSMNFDEMYELLIKSPGVLKRPIIYQADAQDHPRRLQVGYNLSDLEIFLRDIDQEKSFYHSNMHCYASNSQRLQRLAAKDKPVLEPSNEG